MTLEGLREEFDAIWVSANREADQFKDPMLVLERVKSTYYSLSPKQQDAMDWVFADWVLDKNEAKRWDALALVRELRISCAAPALRALSRRLENSDDPGAPFERKKIEGLLVELGSDTYSGA